MSVINETLDNLKQTKKRTSGPLNPSSSAQFEFSKQASIAVKPYVAPVSLAVVIGAFFYIAYPYFSSSVDYTQPKDTTQKQSSWFGKKSELSKKTVPSSVGKKEVVWVANPLAQGLYYDAMNLLNQGKEEQALQSLQQIIKQYPEFTPAQKVYSMLTVH
ncbi:MAG: hypothetical protein CK424_04285 [Legionella sp.]|nr:MAG: hypothetical protein CK424_04285 [Legionella sp.]